MNPYMPLFNSALAPGFCSMWGLPHVRGHVECVEMRQYTQLLQNPRAQGSIHCS